MEQMELKTERRGRRRGEKERERKQEEREEERERYHMKRKRETALCKVLACDSSGIFTCPFLTFTDWELPQPGSLSVEWVLSVKTLEVRASDSLQNFGFETLSTHSYTLHLEFKLLAKQTH